MIRALLLLAAAAWVAACTDPVGSRPDPDAELAARIDALVEQHLEDAPAASAAVAVVRGADTVVLRGYGYADVASRRLAGPDTRYEIGSITKQFTAAAILRLAEERRLSLDDDVSRWVPQFPLQGRRVTLRQLLNHTSGIRSYTSDPEAARFWSREVPPDSIIAVVANDPFDFEPGSAWRYNNTGYVLLGMVIERVTGQSYATYLDEQFFRPLGLTRTRYCPARETRDTSYARGYSSYGSGSFQAAMHISMSHAYAAGALCSTARDLVKWQRALHGGLVLSASSYQAMVTPESLTGGGSLTYGYGLFVGMLGPYEMLQHGGGIPGFTTFQLYVPERTLSVVVLTNTDARAPEGVGVTIARRAVGLVR